MIPSRVVVVVALIVACPAFAAAATVSPMAGDVRIGTGSGFHRINAPTEVAAGAQIMVGPEGSASITYSQDCVVSAASAAITVVQRGTPCNDFPQPAHFGFGQGGEEYSVQSPLDRMQFTPKVDSPEPEKTAVKKSDDTDSSDDKAYKPPQKTDTAPVRHEAPHEPAADEPPSDHTWLVLGGVVGAGVIALLLATGGGSDSPASP